MRNDLPLEAWLKHHASSSPSAFPERDQDYWRRYEHIKAHLDATYFRNAGAGLAAGDGTLYTQHDRGHVNDVIRSAGRLLGCDQAAPGQVGELPIQKLDPYEVYALLVAILLHDAGNAAGRVGHESKAFTIISEMKDQFVDATERRTIAHIARAHGGKTAGGDKDTIRSVISEDPTDVQGTRVRSRLLAAVLRMADEISEGPTRANPMALRKPFTEATIHNLYCKIIAVRFDLRARQLNLTYDVDIEYLNESFDSDGATTQIIDYIAGRIAKCDSERQYCNRYFASLLMIEKISARLQVTQNDGEDLLFSNSYEFIDEGYPTPNATVKSRWPKNAAVLEHCRQKIAGGDPQ